MLRERIGSVRRRLWMLVVIAALAVGAAYVVQREELPTYTVQLLLQQRPVRSSLEAAVGIQQAKEAPTLDFGSEVEIIRSRGVLGAVVDSLRLRLRPQTHQGERTRIFKQVELSRSTPPGSYLIATRGAQDVLLNADTKAVIARAPANGWLAGPGVRIRVGDRSLLAEEPVAFSIALREQAVNALRGAVQIDPGKGADLVHLQYSDPDPVMAAAVINVLADAVVEHHAAADRDVARRRREFLEKQLAQLADSLRDATQLVVQYQQQEKVVDPQVEGNAVYSELLHDEDQLRTMRFQEGLLGSLVAAFQAGQHGAALERLMAAGRDLVPGAAELYNRLQDLESHRLELTASRFGNTDNGPEVQVVDSQINATRRQIQGLAEQSLRMIGEQRADLSDRIGELQQRVSAAPGRSASLTRLQQRTEAVGSVVNQVMQQYYEAQMAEAVATGDMTIVDPAQIPLQPDPSNTARNLLLALVLGIFLGIGAIFGSDSLETRVQRATHAEDAAKLRIVGRIPRIRASAKPAETNAGYEAFRMLATNLRSFRGGTQQVLAITSAAEAEGKSTVAVNLAIAMAQQGVRVLLVDSDLRRPMLHRLFGVSRSPGLAEVVQGKCSLSDGIREIPGAGLHILSAGDVVSAPSVLIGSDAFALLLDQLRRQFQTVVIDTPPTMAVADASMIAMLADGVVFVARANYTDRFALREAAEQLRHVNAALLGLVLTDVPAAGAVARYSYGYYRYPDYSGTTNGSKPPRKQLLTTKPR